MGLEKFGNRSRGPERRSSFTVLKDRLKSLSTGFEEVLVIEGSISR